MPKVKSLVLAALLLAVLIVFERFVSLQSPVLRLSFSYVPGVLAGWLLGPLWAALIGALGDVLGMLILPKGGAYFPGFTLSAALTCAVYGLFLYNKSPVKKGFLLRLILALLVVHVFIRLGLTTVWLMIITKRAYLAILAGRVIANLIELPVEIVSMYMITRFLEPHAAAYIRTEDRVPPENGGGGGDIPEHGGEQ
jgi:ECF transporter S component (folate family)